MSALLEVNEDKKVSDVDVYLLTLLGYHWFYHTRCPNTDLCAAECYVK